MIKETYQKQENRNKMNNLKKINRAIKENPKGIFVKRCYNSMGQSGCEYQYRLPKQNTIFSINVSTAKALEKKGINFRKVKHFRELY